jgi:alkylation response protein AidB-like acyl-CoA dehydrogenase
LTIIDRHPIRQADFELSDDHKALRDVFSGFFERECPPARVRENEPGGFDKDLWSQLLDMRIVAMGVPEAAGGDGAGHVDLVLLTEQWGRHLAPVPLAESVAAARVLARFGPSDWLDGALDGSRLVTLSHHGARSGQPQLVPAGAIADGVIALIGEQLVVASADVTPAQVANQGHAPLAMWDLAGDSVTTDVVATGSEAVEAFADLQLDWKLLMAGALVGMADGALRIAIEHAKDRIAFGVPIGSFQAVAHPLVDVAMDLEVARRITWKAAWWADTDPTVERQQIPMAYLYAEESAVRSATVGVHTLGGVGFTVESDEQLYFRRAKGWTLTAGDPQSELDAIADGLWEQS